MPLADYFHRSAVAASQVLTGYDEEAIRDRLEATTVAIAIEAGADEYPEGQALVDLTIRLLARLYPRLSIEGSSQENTWRELARAINPNIDLTPADASVAIAIGNVGQTAPVQVYVGCNRWDAAISSVRPQPVGDSLVPFGAGVAACLGAANMFRAIFLPHDLHATLDDEIWFSTLNLRIGRTTVQPIPDGTISLPLVIVGLGAIGNGAAWALGRMATEGPIYLVDHETIELGNLQRYVLASRSDEGRAKVGIAASMIGDAGVPQALRWDQFLEASGYALEHVLVGVDSAAIRHQVQASLPKWIANAWTQPGDLGVSAHPWTAEGACLSCLYLPSGIRPNEDDLIANALRLSPAEHGLEIRRLLHSGEPPSLEILRLVAQNLEVPFEDLEAFSGRPIRDLYVEGICGGALVPLDRLGRPNQNVHVPLAHQSALAGVLLAARAAQHAAGLGPASTEVTRLNVQRPLAEYITQPIKKDARGICICQDADYQEGWSRKFG